MTGIEPRLHLQTPPFLRSGLTTPGIMGDVLIGLSPVVLASLWYFGVGAALIIGATSAGAVLVEWATTPDRRSLRDGSAFATGAILALTLPPTTPLWVAFLGGIVAVGLGKAVWGGLGQNPFNPALVGRAFLQAAFPTVMTTWRDPGGSVAGLADVPGRLLAVPMMSPVVDGVSAATPLAAMKFDGQLTEILPLFVGYVSGSLGETSAFAVLLGGAFMLARGTFDWRIPTGILSTVAVASSIFYVLAPDRFPPPWFMLLAGGLLFGAVFMATDPVTSPMSPRGTWLFGMGVGVLVVLIRLFGGLPEGVMYAILLMNAATPLIERATQPRPFGRRGVP